jgi:hypothetical protein
MREQTEQYLLALETELLSNVNRYMIEMSQNWVKKMPYEGGIFLLRDEGVICYVESTSNIQNSLNSFLINRNHELRRRLAIHKFNIGFTNEKTLAPLAYRVNARKMCSSAFLKRYVLFCSTPSSLGK